VSEIELKIEIKALNERTANDIGLQRDLLECFEKNLGEVRNSLTTYALEDNRNAMKAELHKLKGSVGIFGFVNVSEHISCIEKMLESDTDADFSAMFSDLFSAIENHIVELKSIINK
jgi:HPt (histidine-containing phosphotransfer) domain-containing protein